MRYAEFLARVIDEGSAAARVSYPDGDKLRGALAGYAACRDRSPAELKALLSDKGLAADRFVAKDGGAPPPYTPEREAWRSQYWELRCAALEIEWVCNVVSAALTSAGCVPIVAVTIRGLMKAASILGAAEVAESAP